MTPAAPDLRIGFDFTRPAPPLRIVVANPASAWRRGGLRTGDELTSVDQVSVTTFDELRHVLGGLHVGQTVAVDIRRDGHPMRLAIPVTGYTTARVRFVDVDGVSALQTARRAKWLAGWRGSRAV